MASRSGGGVIRMKDWSADKIIAVGITLAFLLIVLGADIVAVSSGDMSITNLGKELVIGLFGYMGRGAVNSLQSNQSNNITPPSSCQSQVSNTLGSIAETASNAQAVVNAVDTLTHGIKDKK